MDRAHRNVKSLLTPKEEAFISAYLGSASNAVSAAAKAGYKSPRRVAFQLMHRPHIAAEIERRRAVWRESDEFDIHKLQEWLAYSATFDPTTIFKPGTKELLPMSKWPDQRLRYMVESVKISEKKDGTKRIKFGFTSRSRSARLLTKLTGALKKVQAAAPESEQ